MITIERLPGFPRAAALGVLVLAASCDLQRSGSPAEPSSVSRNLPSASGSSGTTTPSYAGTWSSQAVQLTPPADLGCVNIEWTVTSQTTTAEFDPESSSASLRRSAW